MSNRERGLNASQVQSPAEQQVSFDQLKAQVSIERVLREILQWQPDKVEGDELRGECPICRAKAGTGKKSRAFAANTAKNRFYCHSCHKNGSIIDLVMLTKNVSAREAGLTIHHSLLDSGNQPKEEASAQKQIVETPIAGAKQLSESENGAISLLSLDLLEVRRPEGDKITVEPLQPVELVLLAKIHPDLLRLLPHLTLHIKSKD